MATFGLFAMELKKRKRGAGPRLSDLQRLEILRRHQSASPRVSLRQLARDFGVDDKTIRRVVASADAIEQRSSSAALGRRNMTFRRSSPRFPELEKTLVTWIDARQRAKEEISPSVVIDKAKLVARSMDISPTDFKASWGWYDKFCKRYGIRTAFVGAVKDEKQQRRESGSLQELHAKMEEYDPEWVFTVDETALFYDALPFDFGESGVSVGESLGRNRVTLVVCCNSTGRMTPPVCVVGKETWPEEMDANFPLPYLTQPRAWLDRSTFGRWFDDVFVPFVRERTSKSVLLVADGTRPGHQGGFEQDGVKAVFLPPPPQFPQISSEQADISVVTSNKTVWWTKPLEMGILAALKARYKYLLVRSTLWYHDAPQEVKASLQKAHPGHNRNRCGVHFGQATTLLDAARLIGQAWSNMPRDLLENCFARANLVPPSKLLATPALPSPGSLSRQTDVAKRVEEEVAEEIEKLILSSSLLQHDCSIAPILRERVRAYLQVDKENSTDFQRQLHGELQEELGDVAPVSTSELSQARPPPTESVNTTDNVNSGEPATITEETSSTLRTQVRELLLGVTDVASRLRLLPQSGIAADKLTPQYLEEWITAADQIRHCIQSYDSQLHSKVPSSCEEESMPRPNNGEDGPAALPARPGDDEVALV